MKDRGNILHLNVVILRSYTSVPPPESKIQMGMNCRSLIKQIEKDETKMQEIKTKKMSLDYYLGNYPNLKIQGIDLSILEAQDYILDEIITIVSQSGYEVFFRCSPIEKEILLEQYGETSFFIEDIYIIGSRIHGTHKENSDLDVLIEYDSNCREDSLFTYLNEENIELCDVAVDINPISIRKSGSSLEWLKKNF